MPPPELPEVETLIPHRGPMRLVRRILEAGEGFAVCEGRIAAAGPCADGESAPAFLGVELAAQTVAVAEGMAEAAAPTDEGPRMGYLVALDSIRLAVDRLPVGETLVSRVEKTAGAGALAVYDVRVTGPGGEELLAGGLSTFLAGG